MPQGKSTVPRPAAQEAASYRERDRNILSISAAPEDHDSLRGLLSDPNWHIIRAFSCQQAMNCLCRNRVGVIICDCHLPDGTWRDILSQIAPLTEPPAVIVTSMSADAGLRAEVRAMGAYDVLSKPFVREEVASVVAGAWDNRVVVIAESAPV
jgi:DNA-binding NtrC family response regulator